MKHAYRWTAPLALSLLTALLVAAVLVVPVVIVVCHVFLNPIVCVIGVYPMHKLYELDSGEVSGL